jgi:hypothetical protein
VAPPNFYLKSFFNLQLWITKKGIEVKEALSSVFLFAKQALVKAT